VSFAVSPKHGGTPYKNVTVEKPPSPAVQKLIDRGAAGWENVALVQDDRAVAYTGTPSLDVYAEDWLVYSMGGDIQILCQRDPQLRIELPITINTREREFDPSLVRTHDGRYALLWARGTGKRNAKRFVAVFPDFLRWETPGVRGTSRKSRLHLFTG
jgi:hypothetical protein